MNKQRDNVLVIYAKKPELGKTKTRIAKETSKEFAYQLSKSIIRDLINNLSNSHYYDLFMAVDTEHEAEWFQNNYGVSSYIVKQHEGNDAKIRQSKKFNYIFNDLLSGNYNYSKAILVPMDVPYLTTDEIISAFARLEKYDYVYGPEINGGVYLIGLNQNVKENVFNNVQWSTNQSFEMLIQNSRKGKYYDLKYRRDLNNFNDILSLKSTIADRCPNLYELLKENNYYESTEGKYINFDDLNINIPVISAIVERKIDGQDHILVQTRFKPSIDPGYSNFLEIPNGHIEKHEPAKEAAIREVFEETGITAEIIGMNDGTSCHSTDNDIVISFEPFLCLQQIRGGRAYLSTAFLCKYKSGNLKANYQENRKPHWMKLSELKQLINEKPETIYPLNYPVIVSYLKYKQII